MGDSKADSKAFPDKKEEKSKTIKAVVVKGVKDVSVQNITLDPPKKGEILVQMKATGVCHSDLSVVNGVFPVGLPVIIGHEGAGIVSEIGPDVTNIKIGDHVVLSFIPNCQSCFHCLRTEPYLCEMGRDSKGKMFDKTSRAHMKDIKDENKSTDLNVFCFLGCMAEYAVVPAISVVTIDKKIPLDKAALVGCGVMTGVGAVINTAKVTLGSTVAIFGAGGVGSSVIQGARLAGASKIIAIDLLSNKLEIAKELGATHIIDASKLTTSVVEEVKKLTEGGRGVDYAFEVIGVPSVMEQAYQVTRRGGTICLVGIGKYTEHAKFNSLLLPAEGKKIVGCIAGSSNFRYDMPRLLELYVNGKLNLDKIITQTYTIDEARDAFEDLEKGKNLRGVILYS